MPHCLLEYSNNTVEQPDLKSLLRAINEHLASTGLFALEAIKSRAIVHDHYAVGDGDAGAAFVALEVILFDGRSDATKAQLSAGLLRVIEPCFARTLASKPCDITVRITDMHRASYAKTAGPDR